MHISLRRRAVLLGTLLIVSLFALTTHVHAWTGPTAAPPNNNVAAPVNVGSAGQVKAGDFATLGKMGVGTASPGAKLDVNGAANINGGSSSNWAGLNVGGSNSIQTAGSIYSYSGICVGENTGHCTGSGGTVINGSGVRFPDGTTQTTAAQSSSETLATVTARGATTNTAVTFGAGPYTNDWFRVNGSGGIYWQAYGGGWYMQDSTWIRSYNGRYVYMNPGFDTAGASGVACNGGVGGGYTFRVCGTMQAQRYYDDDGGYYIDSNVDSQMNTVYANAFYYRSDERLKKNIQPLQGSLAKVLKLDGVTFNWKDGSDGGKPQIGFIAQDVEQVVPELVSTAPNTGMKAVDYSKVGPLLVNALKEQEQKIEAQQREIDDLKAAVDALKSR